MKNKQHKYIIKAFLETRIPSVISQNCCELMLIDSIIGGYCVKLMQGAATIELSTEIISQSQKKAFSSIINKLSGQIKDEVVLYYRLLIIVEAILLQYANPYR